LFHVLPYGETPLRRWAPTGLGTVAWHLSEKGGPQLSTDFEKGFLVGLLVGEGHFGGDGRQPQVTLRMHVRHEALFLWIERTFPGGKLYGPYNHDGRHYFQWMARGSYLRDVLVPILDEYLKPELDGAGAGRYGEMKARYRGRLGQTDSPSVEDGLGSQPPPEAEEQPPEAEERRAPGLALPDRQSSTAAEIFDRLRRKPPL
jgi:hypothetical protein